MGRPPIRRRAPRSRRPDWAAAHRSFTYADRATERPTAPSRPRRAPAPAPLPRRAMPPPPGPGRPVGGRGAPSEPWSLTPMLTHCPDALFRGVRKKQRNSSQPPRSWEAVVPPRLSEKKNAIFVAFGQRGSRGFFHSRSTGSSLFFLGTLFVAASPVLRGRCAFLGLSNCGLTCLNTNKIQNLQGYCCR